MPALRACSRAAFHTAFYVRPSPPGLPVLVYPPKQLAGGQVGGLKPFIEQCLNPARHRYCPDVAGFAFQVDDGPAVFPLLDVAEIQVCRLLPPEAAGEEDRQERTVPFAFQKLRVRCIPEPLRLFRRQPIPEPDADLLDSLDASYACGQVGA
jgi:hypothetical protein